MQWLVKVIMPRAIDRRSLSYFIFSCAWIREREEIQDFGSLPLSSVLAREENHGVEESAEERGFTGDNSLVSLAAADISAKGQRSARIRFGTHVNFMEQVQAGKSCRIAHPSPAANNIIIHKNATTQPPLKRPSQFREGIQ